MSIADLTRRLKEAEEVFEEVPMSMQQDGKLYLTEEEWDARRNKCEAENHSGGGARDGSVGKGCGHGRGRGHSGSSSGGSSNKPTDNKYQHCSKIGHCACECRSKPKKEYAHVTQEEEEGSLLLMMATLTRSKDSSTPGSIVEAISSGVEI
jgi:hypothetical protein